MHVASARSVLAPRLHHSCLNSNALSMEMHSCRHRVDAQASKAGGGRVIEQQKQQKKREQKQTGGSETSLSLDSAGAVSIDVVEAHIPTPAHAQLSFCRVLAAFLSHTPMIWCAGCTGG